MRAMMMGASSGLMKHVVLILVVLCCGGAFGVSCGGAAPSEPMSSETFIEIVVSLRRAAYQATPEQFEASKAEILSEHGVTDSMLTAYVQRHGRDIPMMAEIWDSIDARLAAMLQDTAIDRR